ncbi:MAG TPA: trypsin-like peptidase domain-containing protein [Candidatus Saccharimonadia bacterium]|nr:trypsin-like peptidase domain-containing protein [Candidatus Saccharimonadia bacterium]
MKFARLWGLIALAVGSTGAAANALSSAQQGEFCAADATGTVSVPALTLVDKSDANLAFEMAQLHARLSASAPLAKVTPIQVELTAAERTQIGHEGDGVVRANERRLQVGVAKPLGIDVDLARANGLGQGVLERNADGLTWTIELSSPGAAALRVGFANLDLPDAAALYVYNADGEAHGPYTGRGMLGRGDLVSNTVGGDTVRVQLEYAGNPTVGDLARLRFTIAELGHIGPRFQIAARMNPKVAAANPKAFCSYNASCVVNGECASNFSAHAATREGVAHMLFQSGASFYICSGGLLNNSQADGRLLFLTANHCISTSNEAASLETFWDYRARSCTDNADSGPCGYSYATMRTTYPTALGATRLASGSSGDYSLMELAQRPTGTLTFLPWTNTAVASTTSTLHRLSHPSGAPQAYSRQNVTPSSFTCGTLPRGAYIYSQDTAGATEGGSSGSPILDASGQVVGQLYGACGTNLNDECDANANRTVDGALAHYYPNVAAFLSPSGGGGGGTTASVASNVVTVVTQGKQYSGRATVTIRDQNGANVANATVSGTWSGAVSGAGSGVTGTNGVATINSAKVRTNGTFTFCVTNVTGTGITYSGGTTCDSN